MPNDRRHHVSVLAHEVLAYLCVRPGARYVDGTLGDGGHTERLLEADRTVDVLGVDRDALTLAATAARLTALFGGRFHPYAGNFDEIDAALAAVGWDRVDGGILLDLGVSSRQLDDPERGFSFRAPGPLDMRMTPGDGPSAADLVATLDERRLADVLWRFGEEPASRRIARAIVAERARRPITDTETLADIVARVVPRSGSLHPATRVFQALRIVVNDELEHLDRFLEHVLAWVRPGARLVIIAYHSLEDRRVKQAFRNWAAACRCPPALPRCACGARARVRILTRKVVTPSADEVRENRRARSARLRAAEVLEAA
jgi:16S rRNA (cytosine1402-N4)-methyltransferase